MNAPEPQPPLPPRNYDAEILATLERLEDILCLIHNLLLSIEGKLP